MLKSVGACTQPCFVPFLIGNGSEDEPSHWTVPYDEPPLFHSLDSSAYWGTIVCLLRIIKTRFP